MAAGRSGFLQLDEGMVAMNQDMGQGGIILASDGDYLTQKDGTIPQFAALNIVDGQVRFLCHHCSVTGCQVMGVHTDGFVLSFTTFYLFVSQGLTDDGILINIFCPRSASLKCF